MGWLVFNSGSLSTGNIAAFFLLHSCGPTYCTIMTWLNLSKIVVVVGQWVLLCYSTIAEQKTILPEVGALSWICVPPFSRSWHFRTRERGNTNFVQERKKVERLCFLYVTDDANT